MYARTTMRNAWEKLKDETDKLAQEHTDVAKALADQTARLASFSDTNKNKRKQVSVSSHCMNCLFGSANISFFNMNLCYMRCVSLNMF